MLNFTYEQNTQYGKTCNSGNGYSHNQLLDKDGTFRVDDEGGELFPRDIPIDEGGDGWLKAVKMDMQIAVAQLQQMEWGRRRCKRLWQFHLDLGFGLKEIEDKTIDPVYFGQHWSDLSLLPFKN